jgi:hypothetical protein
MKKLIILALLFITISVKAQVFITINPAQGHFNPGILGNVMVEQYFGFYGNILYGDIKYTKDPRGNFIANQLKYGAGISYKLKDDVVFLLGFSSVQFYVKENTINYKLDNYIKPAVNIGFFAELPTKRIMRILFFTDVNNWESQLGFSINLKK